MTDVIERLTRKAFERWMSIFFPEYKNANYWNELVIESQRREPVVGWAFIDERTGQTFLCTSKENADVLHQLNDGRVVKLVEQE